MSGFEVAGIVLAVAPMIISALESYQKLGKRFDAFRKKSIHIGRMIRALSSQRRLIQSDVEIVLRNAGAVDPAQTTGYAIADSLETLLHRKDVQEEVKAFLGNNYNDYVAVLLDCERVLLDIARSISSFAKVDPGSLSGLLLMDPSSENNQGDFWKRVRFTMGRDDIEQAIRELDETSTRLSRLSQQSHQIKQIELVSPSSKAKSIVSLLRKMQARAIGLHGAFSRSWQLQCHNDHTVRLHLDPRLTNSPSKAPGKMGKDMASTFCVTLISGDGQQSLLQYTCNVHPMTDEDDHDSNSTHHRKVTFQTATSVPGTDPPKWKLKNICHTVNQCQGKSDTGICLYLSDDAVLHYCNLPAQMPKSTAQQTAVGSTITLSQLMRSSAVRFSLKQRMKMAAILSSSIMQLYSTPWWSAGLQKDFIFLPYDGSKYVDFHNPFVSCHFTGSQGTLSANPSNPSSLKGELELLHLGILIIELWQNETIEDFARKSNLVLENTYDSRQSVARKWLALLEEDLVTSVYNSALRCINCRFDAAVIDLESNVKLNQSIFELVVKPLWENCEH